ncbi:MAG TPA: hypothetical protein PKK11_02505 [Methanothrix sp.]|nr:hypothetical protein [Methanothrix sp.]
MARPDAAQELKGRMEFLKEPFWEKKDQRHRQALTAGEMRKLIAAARRARAGRAGARS